MLKSTPTGSFCFLYQVSRMALIFGPCSVEMKCRNSCGQTHGKSRLSTFSLHFVEEVGHSTDNIIYRIGSIHNAYIK